VWLRGAASPNVKCGHILRNSRKTPVFYSWQTNILAIRDPCLILGKKFMISAGKLVDSIPGIAGVSRRAGGLKRLIPGMAR
jgi:hypothetical protein